MSQFGETTLNSGSGGPALATSTFNNTSGSDHALMPWSALVYMAGGNANDGTAVFQTVDATHGLPANIIEIGGSALAFGQAVMASSLPVVIASNQSAVPVSGTFWQATQPVSVASLPALPAHQSVNVDEIGGSALAFGQAVMASSLPVVIASNQSAVPVSGTFWQATQPVSVASLPALPAHQSVNVDEIGGSALAFGQAVMASSIPVVIASNQSALPVSGTFWQATQPVSVASLPALPAHQSVNVDEIGGSALAFGQAAMAGSLPVAIASNQSNVPVNSAQVAGTTTSVNEGSSDAGTTRVAIGRDDSMSTYSAWSAASDNATNVKASAGHVFRIEVTNVGSGAVYLKLYNKASTPNPASDTPVRRFIVPGNTAGAGAVCEYLKGRNFSTGIGYVLSGAAGDTDTTAIAANQCAINIDYE